jgi:UDPglucose 6-dehydrogenase
MIKIAIIGLGFVGSSLLNGLKDSVEVLRIDPKLGNKTSDLKDFLPEIVFICVPTPMNEDKTQDISIIESVVAEIKDLDLNFLTVLKSTVLPNHLKNIESSLDRFLYNPEFLREKHANEDFINSPLIVFGGNKEDAEKLSGFYKDYTKCICNDYVYTDLVTASLIKYTINSFLSVKGIFFNELKELFIKSDANDSWENFISFLSKDIRIGNSHMQVPGHDGRFGFGGACLPKDSNAFAEYADSYQESLNILKIAIKLNNDIRSSYNTKLGRELDQNIDFKESDN